MKTDDIDVANIIDVGWRMGKVNRPKKVLICIPTYPTKEPYPETLAAIEAEKDHLTKAGWSSELLLQHGLPYISAARACLLHTALKREATDILFVDQDISWAPGSVVRILETEGGMVAGTYRYKGDEERYMGGLNEVRPGIAAKRPDGCLEAQMMPAGFLRVTRAAVNKMIVKYPELCCGEASNPHYDMFSHGVMDGVWQGEDAAACRRWWQMGEKVWCIPDLEITHHSKDKAYPGNLAKYLERIVGNSTEDLGKFTIRAVK
jgi:hypothetical protein